MCGHYADLRAGWWPTSAPGVPLGRPTRRPPRRRAYGASPCLRVALLQKKRKEYERQRWFRRAFALRAGIEVRISVLRRGYSLERCPHHGEDGMGRWVGWGIVVHNLAKISKKQAARQNC
jgi:hypothetical protein